MHTMTALSHTAIHIDIMNALSLVYRNMSTYVYHTWYVHSCRYANTMGLGPMRQCVVVQRRPHCAELIQYALHTCTVGVMMCDLHLSRVPAYANTMSTSVTVLHHIGRKVHDDAVHTR